MSIPWPTVLVSGGPKSQAFDSPRWFSGLFKGATHWGWDYVNGNLFSPFTQNYEGSHLRLLTLLRWARQVPIKKGLRVSSGINSWVNSSYHLVEGNPDYKRSRKRVRGAFPRSRRQDKPAKARKPKGHKNTRSKAREIRWNETWQKKLTAPGGGHAHPIQGSFVLSAIQQYRGPC